jgi:hypothetical protein
MQLRYKLRAGYFYHKLTLSEHIAQHTEVLDFWPKVYRFRQLLGGKKA